VYNRLKLIFCLGVVIGLPSVSLATQQAGDFLNIGIGARPMGMGGAFGAVADDAFAAFWNPAGISLLDGKEIGLMYASLFGLVGSHVLSVVYPLNERAAVAVSWVRVSADNIPRYDPFPRDAQRIEERLSFAMKGAKGYFSDREDALFFTFSKVGAFDLDFGWQYFILPLKVPFGVNLKLIHQSLGGASANGIGIDAGFMLRFGANILFGHDSLGDVSIGLVVSDITNTTIVWETRHHDVIPYTVRFSIAYFQPLRSWNDYLCVSLEKEGDETIKAGLEYWFDSRVALRGGVNREGPGAGVGVVFGPFEVDYAFVAQDLGAVHRVSAKMDF